MRQVPPSLTVPVLQGVPETHVGCPLAPHATHMLPAALKPALQLMPQVLLEQVADPLLGTGHTVHIDPQKATLAVVLRQVPPQLVRPLLQTPPVQTGWASPPQGTHMPPEATKPTLQVNPQLLLTQVRTPLLTVAHTLVQLPQPSTSVESTRQVPEQLVWPVGQVVVHMPAAHTWFITVLQTVPQVPQLLLSLLVLTQDPPQNIWPLGQTQFPAVQVRPPEQTVPQVPQLLLSLARVRQVPEQLVCPLGHAQAPFWQVRPPVQAVPQPVVPQKLASVRVSRHCPLQKVCPDGQVFSQVPETQA